MTAKYVYLYFDPSRNEPIYVGIGQGPRLSKHRTRTDRHPFTHRLALMKSNGVEPIITKVCDDLDQELAELVEQELISKFGRKDLKKGPLLNLTDGGDGCHNPSPETRAKMSAARRGVKQSAETIEKRVAQMRGKPRPQHVIDAMVKANTGAKRSAESCANIGAGKRGRKLSPEHKAKIAEGLRNSKRYNNGND